MAKHPASHKNKSGQIAGGPRQKLMQVMRASGVSDKAAANLTNQALGPAPSRNQPKSQSQPKSLRKQLIGKLREIGAKARSRLLGKKKKKKATTQPQQ